MTEHGGGNGDNAPFLLHFPAWIAAAVGDDKHRAFLGRLPAVLLLNTAVIGGDQISQSSWAKRGRWRRAARTVPTC